MKNSGMNNSEIEKLLKEKMDGLASGVDCFDRISKKAFPEQKKEYSDSEFTICDLENVTGKRKSFRFSVAVAISAVLALCLFFLPKNGMLMNFVYSNIGSSGKAYRELICEIGEETEKYSYASFDCSLEEYISGDVLITPLYGCPFEENKKDNINVRIYVKMCGEVPTNQIYAIEYEGEYEESNFIAAADSKAKFSEEELQECKDISFADSDFSGAFDASAKNYDASAYSFTNDSGEPTAYGGFSYSCLYKYQGEIIGLSSEFVYYLSDSESENQRYSYDFVLLGESGGSYDVSDLPEGEWNNVLYFGGSSAQSEEELSDFTRSGFFSQPSDSGQISSLYIMPFAEASEIVRSADMYGRSITVSAEKSDNVTAEIIPPLEPSLRDTFRIYVPDTATDWTVSSNDSRLNRTYEYSDICALNERFSYTREDMAAQQEQEAAENEELQLRREQERAQLESIQEQYQELLDAYNSAEESEKANLEEKLREAEERISQSEDIINKLG